MRFTSSGRRGIYEICIWTTFWSLSSLWLILIPSSSLSEEFYPISYRKSYIENHQSTFGKLAVLKDFWKIQKWCERSENGSLFCFRHYVGWNVCRCWGFRNFQRQLQAIKWKHVTIWMMKFWREFFCGSFHISWSTLKLFCGRCDFPGIRERWKYAWKIPENQACL